MESGQFGCLMLLGFESRFAFSISGVAQQTSSSLPCCLFLVICVRSLVEVIKSGLLQRCLQAACFACLGPCIIH